MDNRNITSITVNYDNGDSESFNKGCELEMVVESIISLANKIGMFDDKEN